MFQRTKTGLASAILDLVSSLSRILRVYHTSYRWPTDWFLHVHVRFREQIVKKRAEIKGNRANITVVLLFSARESNNADCNWDFGSHVIVGTCALGGCRNIHSLKQPRSQDLSLGSWAVAGEGPGIPWHLLADS